MWSLLYRHDMVKSREMNLQLPFLMKFEVIKQACDFISLPLTFKRLGQKIEVEFCSQELNFLMITLESVEFLFILLGLIRVNDVLHYLSMIMKYCL